MTGFGTHPFEGGLVYSVNIKTILLPGAPMKNLTKTLIAAAALSAVASSAMAQASASDDASVGITVLRPVSVTADPAGLQFGSVVAGAGLVTVSNAGSRTVANTAYAVGDGSDASAAEFEIKAEGGQTLDIDVPTTVTLSGPGAATLTVNTTSNVASLTTTGTLGTEATYDLAVGGSVTIGSSVAPGAYSGTLTVEVSYQ
jgi:hypothetical protein